jgi:hypothetical protein
MSLECLDGGKKLDPSEVGSCSIHYDENEDS